MFHPLKRYFTNAQPILKLNFEAYYHCELNIYILEAVTYVHLKSPDEVMTGAQQHDYNTRHAANYHLPAHRLTSTEKKPTYVGAKLWNALPLELKRRDRLQFGHKLKLWLQDHPFYTINEFLNCTVL
ncbi:hypothetical protein J6590_075762 [Homalodisca vitripennis]|nr:hypothetical protein J6590_075762 [Homalodisca vitripennis]